MKASIITMHSVCNYGTQLQALATQEKLKEYFGEVEFVNFRRNDTYGIRLMKTFSGNNPIKMIIILPTLIKWKYVFRHFQKKYLNISKNDYHIINSDVYFSGSDQVWNTGWNNGVIPEYYLSFVPDEVPKYSYSSSFGKEELSESDVKQSIKFLKRYNRISVREESGLGILINQYGIKNGIRILDPTLVMPKEFWLKHNNKRKIKEDYILVYNLNRSKEFDNYVKKLSKKTGLKVYRFCTRYDQILRYGKSIIIPNILDFISYINYAKFVVTDSFHATAFSINMNVHPICLYPNNYSNRLSDFLKLVNAEKECHPRNYDDFGIINYIINFDKVNNILDKERKRVDIYLENIKNDCLIDSEIKNYD